MLATSLILEGCIARYVLARGDLIGRELLAATPHEEAELEVARFHARLAHRHLLGAIRHHEDATGLRLLGALLAAVDRQVVLAEELGRCEAVRILTDRETLNPRSAA